MTSTRRSASRGYVMSWPPWIVPMAFAQGTADDAKADVSIDDPRVLAVIATLLVRRRCRCGSLIAWFLRCISCFGAAMARGEFISDAAVEAGTYRKQGSRWLVAAGGVRPRPGRGLKGRCLRLAQREEIALGRARGQSVRSIAAAIGRAPSTVSRELRRNADRLGGYRQPRRTPWLMPGRRGRSRRSWSPTWCFVARWRPTWPRSNSRSRSAAG
jgi:hypothetical protein